MKYRIVSFATAAVLLAASSGAIADHNSKNGEGWANMPNDIHNMRIETKEADDNEAFKDFVKYGEGSRTENRFDTDSATPTQSGSKQSQAKSQERKRVDTNTATNTRTNTETRSETRSRQRIDTNSMSRSNRSSSAARSSVNRSKGGKRK